MAKLNFDKQIAIGGFHYVRYPFTYFLDSAVNLGVKNIEIYGNSQHLYVEDMTPQSTLQARRDIEARGLTVACYTPDQCNYALDLVSTNEVLRTRTVNVLQRSLEVSADLGSKYMLLCPGHGYLNDDYNVLWDNARRSIEALLPYAERTGVVMVFETQNYNDCILLTNAAQQRKMLDEINHPNFKVMLDVSQMTQFGDTIADNVRILGDDIRHMHLTSAILNDKDLSLQGEELLKKYPYGRPMNTHIEFEKGDNPIFDYVQEFVDSGYDQFISLEICSRASYINPETPMKIGLDMLRSKLL